MTKTLTEQWKYGELELGTYWIIGSDGVEYIDFLLDQSDFNMITDVKEVLAPVPSYDEYQDLIQQNVNQESAIETYIERIHELEEQIPNGRWFTEKSHNELLRRIKYLEERLADADKTLRFYDNKDFYYEVDGVVMGAEPAHKYFVKWNVLDNKTDLPEWDLSLVEMVELKGTVK